VLDKVDYWLNLCDDNMTTAKWLLEGKRYLDMGFFCHQIAEKALKAVVSSISDEMPPKIHDLKKLAAHGGIYDSLSEKQLVFMENLNPLQIEARYPEYKENIAKTLSKNIVSK